MAASGKVVEADETYHRPFAKTRSTERTRGRPYIKKNKSGRRPKRPVVALVERGGNVRMFHVKDATAANIRDILVRNVSRKSELHTDESRLYTETGKEFADHKTVKHTYLQEATADETMMFVSQREVTIGELEATLSRMGELWRKCLAVTHPEVFGPAAAKRRSSPRTPIPLRLPTIATTHSDASRPPIPIDRDQCGADGEGAVGCFC